MANLVLHHRLRPWEISELTWRQIVNIYFHPQEEDGTIPIPRPDDEMPEGGWTYEQQLEVLMKLKQATTSENWRDAMVKLHQKHGREIPDNLRPLIFPPEPVKAKRSPRENRQNKRDRRK